MAASDTSTLIRDYTDTTDANTGYLMGHDAIEAERLDTQHIFLRHAIGDRLLSPYLEPAIQAGEIRKVLDVGTGTGIWCSHAAVEMRSMGVTRPLSFLGIDIAENEHWARHGSKQPKETSISFGKVDMHDDEAMGSLAGKYGPFDLINLRWLFVAVKKDQWPPLLKRLFKLLRPGGKIQLMELDVLKVHRDGDVRDETSLDFLISGVSMFHSLGVDLESGAKLWRWLRDAGYREVRDTLSSVHALKSDKNGSLIQDSVIRDWLVHAPHLAKPHFLRLRADPGYGKLLDEVVPLVTREKWPDYGSRLKDESEYNDFLKRFEVKVKEDPNTALYLHLIVAEKP